MVAGPIGGGTVRPVPDPDKQGPAVTPSPHPLTPARSRARRSFLVTLASSLVLGSPLAVATTAAAAGTLQSQSLKETPGASTAQAVPRVALALTAVHARTAWRYGKGEGVVVAVIDSGVDPRNKNLDGQVLPGVDFANPARPNGWHDPISFGGHGTGVASVIAGTGRGNGVWGIAPKAKILPVRVANDRGYAPEARMARGIRWAVDHGADVINISMGGYKGDPRQHQAVAYAVRRGVVVVAGAGNDGPDEKRPFTPAAYPDVISVGGWNPQAGKVADLSNNGDWLDLIAPATGVWNTNNDGTRGIAAGTSFASPAVAGAAAVLLSIQPDLTPARVRKLLESTATDVATPGRDTQSGAGLLDVTAAAAKLASMQRKTTGAALNPTR